MASFLEKLNQQAAEGTISTPKSKPNSKPAGDIADEPVKIKEEKTAGPAAVTTPAAPRTDTADMHQSSPQKGEPETNKSGIRSLEHDVEIDRNYGRKNFMRILLTIVICLLIVAGAVAAFRYFAMVELPDFEGKTIAEMRKWCLDNKLYLTEDPVYNMEVEQDYIIRQSVPGGTMIAPKKTIEVTYSLGADPNTHIAVPDLNNMTAPQINSWMTENKLRNVYIYEEYSDEYEKGVVVRYQFSKVTVDESNFKRSDSLTIYVSSGPSISYNSRVVKDFRGLLRSELDSWCSSNGMIAVYTYILSEDVGEDRIISQSIDADVRIDVGSTIEFVISDGPGLIVPDFSKIFKEDASSFAPDFSIYTNIVYSESVPYGGFISQSLAAGTRVNRKDNSLNLVYSMGKPYMPNFVGMHESGFDEFFYNLNRKGANITYTVQYVNSTAAKGTVVKASKDSEAVGLNAVIELEVSNGLGVEPPHEGDPTVLISVPNYANVLKENAVALENEIFVVIQIKYSDTVPYGALISQSIRAGGYVTQDNNQVTLIYSAGRPYIHNLVGMTENELPSIFYEFTQLGASITYEVTYVDVDDPALQPKGMVIASSKSDEFITTNEVIQIQISKG